MLVKYLKNMFFIFTEAQKAYDRLWLIGDDFCYYTVQQYFKEAKFDHGRTHALYAFNNFEVTEFVSSKYKSHNPSVLGQLLNNLMYALNTCKTNLPKVIAVVLDDDVVKNVHAKNNKSGEVQLNIITEWLLREFEKCITIYKDQLPPKAKKLGYPHLLWLCPPTHVWKVWLKLDKTCQPYVSSSRGVMKILRHFCMTVTASRRRDSVNTGWELTQPFASGMLQWHPSSSKLNSTMKKSSANPNSRASINGKLAQNEQEPKTGPYLTIYIISAWGIRDHNSSSMCVNGNMCNIS